LANGFDVVDEFYPADQLWQLTVAVDTASAVLSGLRANAVGQMRENRL
jgi:hypothetical protein